MKVRFLANLYIHNPQQVNISHAMVRVCYRITESILHILITLVLRNQIDIAVGECLKVLSSQMIDAQFMTYWLSLLARYKW